VRSATCVHTTRAQVIPQKNCAFVHLATLADAQKVFEAFQGAGACVHDGARV
jgi:hypothetical protein